METASNNLSVDQLEQARYRLGQYLYHTHYIIIQVQTGPVSVPHTLYHHTGTETGPISVPHTLYHHTGTDWANISTTHIISSYRYRDWANICTPHIISSYWYRPGKYLYPTHHIIIQVQLWPYLYHTHYIIVQVRRRQVPTDLANICTTLIISSSWQGRGQCWTA